MRLVRFTCGKNGAFAPLCRPIQQQLPQPSLHPQLLLHPQLQLPLLPQLLPQPQQQIRMTIMMSHRQEQLLFPLLNHINVTSL